MPPAGTATAAGAWEIPGQEALVAMLFPHLTRLRMHRVADAGEAVVISASCRAESACCPRCGQESSRVHGGYSRVVADGAAGGRPVLIALQVRRFRCLQPECPAVTFAEQAEGVTGRYCRRSVPLTAMLAGFGLELAGRASARLALLLGIAVHPSTVLRLVKALPGPGAAGAAGAPEVLGIDVFALRKGHVYGTVLVDIATADVVDLLPDRDAATVQAWLAAHPGAKVICRDRAGAYAEGARTGAPDGDPGRRQVAPVAQPGRTRRQDRGPPPRLPDAAGTRRSRPPGTAEQEAADHEQEPAGSATRANLLTGAAGEGRLAARTRERYAAVHELLQAGESLHAISRSLSLSRPTVRRFARAASAGELLDGPPAGNNWTRSSHTCTSGGTKASPTPPHSTPNCTHAASPAAYRPSAATWPRSGRPPPARSRAGGRPRPGRSPAGC